MLPYAVHSYGILEPYSLSIPMFAPSIEFAIRANLFMTQMTATIVVKLLRNIRGPVVRSPFRRKLEA